MQSIFQVSKRVPLSGSTIHHSLSSRSFFSFSKASAVKSISHSELKGILAKSDPNTFVIDVRTPAEVAEGIIPGAKHIPLDTIPNALSTPAPEFQKTYSFRKPKQDDTIVFYCKAGTRSQFAGNIASGDFKYENVLNYSGGWNEWSSKK